MRCYAGCCSFNKLRPLPGHVYLSAPAVIDNGVSTVAVQQVQTTDCCTQASSSKYRVSHEEVYSFDFVLLAHLSTDHFKILHLYLVMKVLKTYGGNFSSLTFTEAKWGYNEK